MGNSSTSRIDALSVSSMTRRSTPKPRRPWGQAVLKGVDVVVVDLGLAVRLNGLALSNLALEAGLLVDGVVSSLKALPYSVQSMKYSKRSVKAGSVGLRLASGLISTG